MHAKVVVTDDVAFVGSFNFSRSGERNAENVVEIHDSGVANELATYVEALEERYPRATPPAGDGEGAGITSEKENVTP
jgi:phosphatidylserine/phosphatidylglycerophosphate/cardiolipin synthase-like enzyme